MVTAFGYDGHLFPFSSVIRVTAKEEDGNVVFLRVYFVNGSIDIVDEDMADECYGEYLKYITRDAASN